MKRFYWPLALLFLLLCACGRDVQEAAVPEEPNIQETGQTAEPEPVEDTAMTVVDSDRSLRLQYRDLRSMSTALYTQPLAEGVMLAGVRYQEDDSYEAVSAEYVGDTCWGSGISLEENTWLTAAWSTADRDYYILSTGQGDTITQTIEIALGEEVVLTDLLGAGEEAKWLFGTEDALLVLTPGGRVLAFDYDGALAWSMELDCKITDALQTESGRIFLTVKSKENDETAPRLLRQLDAAARVLLPVCAVPEALRDAALLSGEKWGYDLLAYDALYLYGWTFQSSELVRLADFDALGLNGYRIGVLACLDGTALIGTTYPFESSSERLFLIQEGETADQLTLTVAGITRPMAVSGAIADFNQMYPEYQVEYVDYQELYGDQALTQLALDLQYGDCPDLLFLNAVPYETYARRGLLADLGVYLDGPDGLMREEILPNLLQTLTAEDGAVYRLPQSFSLKTAVALRSVAGDGPSWTFVDFLAAMDAMPEDCAVLADRDPESVLTDVLFHAISRFVDVEAGQAHFDSGVFAQWLELLQAVQARPLPAAGDGLEALKNKELLLVPEHLSSASQYAAMDAQLEGGQVFIGYPDGAATSFYFSNPMAIPANAEHGDAAWQFMQALLTSEGYSMGRWLIVEDQLEASLEAEVLAGGVSQECADATLALIRATGQAVYYDEAIFTIVLDEAAAFFDGARSAGESAALIQDRVQLYLDEGN